MSLHIVVGFKDSARKGQASIIYVGNDLVEGLKAAAQASKEFKSFGRLSNPLWIPAKPSSVAAKTAIAEAPKQSTKAKT